MYALIQATVTTMNAETAELAETPVLLAMFVSANSACSAFTVVN